MAFEQNNLNQELFFNSTTHALENNPMNPSSDNMFSNEQVSFNSPPQIPVNYNISNSNPQINNHEGSFKNPLVEKFLKDLFVMEPSDIYNVDLMDSSFDRIHMELYDLVQSTSKDSENSQHLCTQNEKAREIKRRKIKSGTKEHWNEEDDRALVELVKIHGKKNWNHIAQVMSLTRKGKQLRERYNNHLRPGLKKETWSEEEDMKLIKAHKDLGNKWVEIAKMLPDRSENDIKNRWNATKRRCINAIKKSNTGESNSPFENYVKSIVGRKNLKGAFSVESNVIVRSKGNTKTNDRDLDNGLNGMSIISNPNKLPGVINGKDFIGGSTGMSSSFDSTKSPCDDDITSDCDYLLNQSSSIFAKSNGKTSFFDQNELLDNDDNDDSTWASFMELLNHEDDNDDDDA